MKLEKNGYSWYKSENKLRWWTDPPYNEIDIIDGIVFYNNRGLNSKPFTRSAAIEFVYWFMEARLRTGVYI